MRNFYPIALLVALPACGGDSGEGTITTEDGETISYDIDSADQKTSINISSESGDGQLKLEAGPDVNADMPQGFVLYPGAKVVSQARMDNDRVKNHTVTMRTSDEPQKVLADLRGQAEAAGITIKTTMETEKFSMLSGEGENGRKVIINVNREDGGTIANLSVVEEN